MVKTTKRIAALCLAALTALILPGQQGKPAAATTENPPALYLGDVNAYAAAADTTTVTVPIYADGSVDLRAYHITISFDPELLRVKQDQKTGMLFEEGCHEMSCDTRGEIRLAGVCSSAKNIEGKIGTVTFVLRKPLEKSKMSTTIRLNAEEFGFDTSVSDVGVQDAQATFYIKEAPASPEPVSCSYGDVNKDGTVSSSDALSVLKYVVKLPTDSHTEFDTGDETAMLLADVDGSGDITSADALKILKIVVKLEPERTFADEAVKAVRSGDIPLETAGSRETTAAKIKLLSAGKEETEITEDPAVASKKIRKGDLNGDGSYTVRDSLTALQISEGQHQADAALRAQADVDGDGNVTPEDAALLVRAALGEYESFGYEAPEDPHVIYVDNKTLTKGNYCFHTLTEAVAFLNANPPAEESERVTVYIAPGTYREYTVLEAPYVTYKAMDPGNKPNLTYYYGCGRFYRSVYGGARTAGSTQASTVIKSSAHDFTAENIRFENSYNIYITAEEESDYMVKNEHTVAAREENIRKSSYQTQGLALRLDADRSRIINCDLIGRQDTFLMDGSNRVYAENCYIEGTVDFIYGNAMAVFESCTINSPYNSGHITAASTPAERFYGFLFKDCVLTRNATTESDPPKDASYSLGRPWGAPAMVVYYNCRMDQHISTKNTPNFDRFVTMSEDYPKEKARYGEYGTMDLEGNPVDLTQVAPDYEKILTEEKMRTVYAPYRWLCAKYDPASAKMVEDGWNPGNYPVDKTEK